jgi:ABC-2 type transport system ATP-binding protein
MNLEIKRICKRFNNIPVVNDLSFSVKKGTIVGLLGPNGAGKTTTLRMILDILKPDEGEIWFDGQSINRLIRNQIGYLPEERGLYQKYKVVDILIYFGRLKNLTNRKSHVEAVRLLDQFQMIDYLEEPVGHLSKGTQQKLQFLVSLLHNPEILIMDEPFWGLDPLNQELVKQKILSLRREGKAILVSTHLLADAEAMCDYFVLINRGRSVLQGSLEQIRKNFYQNMIIVETQTDPAALRKIGKIKDFEFDDSQVYLYLDGNASVKAVMREIINKVDVTKIESHRPSLNDIFLQTIKGSEK